MTNLQIVCVVPQPAINLYVIQLFIITVCHTLITNHICILQILTECRDKPEERTLLHHVEGHPGSLLYVCIFLPYRQS